MADDSRWRVQKMQYHDSEVKTLVAKDKLLQENLKI